MRLKVTLLGLMGQIFLTGFLLAQSDRATMTGTVTDSSGGVIPDVSVIAINVDTRVETSGATNDVGLFRILNLPVGQYMRTIHSWRSC